MVVLKALGAAALAGILLLAARKPGHGPLVGCALTALAVVVLSPRLLAA